MPIMAFLDRTTSLTADVEAATADDVLSGAVEVGLVATPETVDCADTVGITILLPVAEVKGKNVTGSPYVRSSRAIFGYGAQKL